MATTERIDTKDTKDVAVLIRRALARAFAGTRFAVRTQRYSMGSHVRVSWTDGPAPWQVDRVIGGFCGTTFDGMDDSTHHHDSEWAGRRVHFSGSQPSTSRRVTDFAGWAGWARDMILTRCACDGAPGHERYGNDWVETLANGMVHSADFRTLEPLEAAFRRVVLREDGA